MSCHGNASVPAPIRSGTATATGPDVLPVLLVGGPNVGKSTLFNALTGARQHTTNAPGTTVELATGTWRTAAGSTGDSAVERVIVDLPGTYSLLARSSDELVTADAVRDLAQSLAELSSQAGVVVVVMDATALPRSLYLLAQVAETAVPTVVALTMLDLAVGGSDSPSAALEPDALAAALAAPLGVPVVPVDARRRAAGGLSALAQAVDDVAAHPRRVTGIGAPRSVADVGQDLAHAETLFAWVERVTAQVTTCLEPGSGWAPDTSGQRVHRTYSDRVDTVLLNPWAGIPVFLGVVWLLFELTTKFAAPLQALISHLVNGPLASAVTSALGLVGLGDSLGAGTAGGRSARRRRHGADVSACHGGHVRGTGCPGGLGLPGTGRVRRRPRHALPWP
jgi:ferrous iron transport protein B